MTIALLFYPTTSTPGHVNDAGYFRNNALRAAKLWSKEQGLTCVTLSFDNTKSERERRAEIVRKTRPYAGEVTVVAFFCHGWTDGMQGGFTRETISAWADMLKFLSVPGQLLRIVLYCCSTGSDRFGHDGDNSFADYTRDVCSNLGLVVQVDCHTTPGDATQNPHVRRLESPAAVGGKLLVDSEDHHVVEMLRTDWRFRFPFKTREQVSQEVAAAA